MGYMTRDEIMQFFRKGFTTGDIYTLSDDDRRELMTTIAESINERMERLINDAIAEWDYLETTNRE